MSCTLYADVSLSFLYVARPWIVFRWNEKLKTLYWHTCTVFCDFRYFRTKVFRVFFKIYSPVRKVWRYHKSSLEAINRRMAQYNFQMNRDKHWPTKHCTENSRLRNTNPTKCDFLCSESISSICPTNTRGGSRGRTRRMPPPPKNWKKLDFLA